MATETVIESATREFKRLKRLADRALQQIPGDAFFSTLAEDDNSVAILVKHLSGNMRSRWSDFLDSDGEKPWRNRDREFEIDANDSRESLDAAWETGWRALFAALSTLGPDDLDRVVKIRGEELTVLQAIHRQLPHYAYHVGQLVFLARHFAGERWQTLSVRRGGSTEFNANPEKYL